MRARLLIVGASAIVALALVGLPSGVSGAESVLPTNVDVSQWAHNESEESIAVNPTDPANIVIVSNVDFPQAGMLKAVSFDGGATWTRSLIGNNDNLGDACCDPSLAFDQYGNLFLAYLYNVENTVPVALSTDGGSSFRVIARIAKPEKTNNPPNSERRLFRFVDQPTIVAGVGAVWMVFNAGGPMVATGARVTALGAVSIFRPLEIVPGSNNCTYGDVAIGPGGQVMQVCALTESGQGGGKLMVSVDPDGLGPAGFGKQVSVTDTHVGGYDFIAPQPDRSVDSEPGLAWDRTGGPHNGRAYLVYTIEQGNESGNTDIQVRYSDDNGQSWSAPVRVNDDTTANSQFLPKISLDPISGHVAVSWYDARHDLGTGSPGDTDGVPNDDAQVFAAFSNDGTVFTPNRRVSMGTSNSADAHNGIDYGDYSGLAYYNGLAHPAWADNSNVTGQNPDGTLHQLDVYTATVPAG